MTKDRKSWLFVALNIVTGIWNLILAFVGSAPLVSAFVAGAAFTSAVWLTMQTLTLPSFR